MRGLNEALRKSVAKGGRIPWLGVILKTYLIQLGRS